MVRCLLVFSIKSRVCITETECTGSKVFFFFFLSKLTSQPDAYLLGEKWLLVLAKFSLTHMPFIVG